MHTHSSFPINLFFIIHSSSNLHSSTSTHSFLPPIHPSNSIHPSTPYPSPMHSPLFPLTQPDYKKIAKNCNLWRNYGDIDDSWQSVKSIIGFYGDDKTKFSKVAGPGNFNDPDMVGGDLWWVEVLWWWKGDFVVMRGGVRFFW